MIFGPRKRQRQEIRDADKAADQHLQRAQDIAAETERLARELAETRRRNHFGESIAAAFQPRRRRLPWTH